MDSNRPDAEAAPEHIAERYRVDRTLGRGGMAEVYQAFDTIAGRVVALKRLLHRDVANAHIEQLFELEYHTLSQLVHPGIVEVYDYHTDVQGAFYTMELLTGGDLRQRAPIDWSELCHRLCDIGSALALLHSRRFVHRDLTPLNVRCTLDDRTKLFDFGSMTPFGRAKHVVGTPPFVAPEALNGEVLDGQTDLYALGATAYYALTGRHAYPARTLAELPDLWSSPPTPLTQYVPGIPAALDELIMALLSLTPTARPPSAADVIERLSAIAGFETREALVVGEAYLTKPTLVGRDEPLAAMARHLKRLGDGRGTALLVSGAAGTGRSRLLDACALEAKLSGALVLRTDAQDSGGRRWGAAAGLLDQLSQQLPDLSARLIAKHTSQLGPMLLEPLRDASQRARVSMAPPGALANQAGRAEIQTALQQLVIEVSRQRPVVLVVDDMNRIDEPTAALLALLAHQARQHRLLVLGSATEDSHDAPAERALQLMASVAETWRLRNLNASQTTALVVSLFGDVPNVRLLADRVFGVTGGNPLSVMRVAQHLVHIGACSYAAGTWSLPATWNRELLSGASREVVDPALSAASLELARSIALSGLPAVSLDECLQLSPRANLKELHADLQQLATSGIVTMNGDEIGLSRPSWESLLLAELSAQSLQGLHLRVAEVLNQRPAASFRVVQHVLQGGEAERALDLLLIDIKNNRPLRIADPSRSFEYLQSLPNDWPETYHALIEAGRRLGRPLREQLDLQIELLAYATLAARTERESMIELAARLRYDCGLDLIAELEGRVAPSELLTQALGAAQQRFDATPERERGLPILEALTALGQLTIQAIAMAGRTFDLSLLTAMPSLAPIAVLSPALAVVQKNLESSIAVVAGQGLRARESYLEIVRRLDEPDGAGLNTTHRVHMRSAIIWAIGSMEADFGRPRALERAAAIESNPLFALSALQLRSMYMLLRGDRAGAERCREQAELLQIQNCPPQMFQGAQLLRLTSNYAAIGDLLRVKQCVVEIEAMARDHAAWRPIVHYGRGAYQSLRGDHAQARLEFDQALASTSPGQHLNWAASAGA
ncbi:MAG TPA: AAA family ATPase, partial [Polyangiales bacterium]